MYGCYNYCWTTQVCMHVYHTVQVNIITVLVSNIMLHVSSKSDFVYNKKFRIVYESST